MARKRSSLFEDFVEVISQAPWWVGVVIAVLAYFLLHPFATESIVRGEGPGATGTYAGQTLIKTLAVAGQYVIPFAALVGSLMSAMKRWEARQLLHTAASADDPGKTIREMSWQDFERLVGEAYRQQGFSVSETPAGADGGVDLELRKGSELHLVQCKQWRAQKVGVSIVRELYGVMAARGAAGGFVVTSGTFTDDATAFAKGRNIVLVDGHALAHMIEKVRASAARPAVQATPERIVIIDTPACPACGRKMVERVAKRGSNAGQHFWGCSGYPGCKGTRPMPVSSSK